MVVGPHARLGYITREMQQRLERAYMDCVPLGRSDDLVAWSADQRKLLVTSWARILSALRHALSAEPTALADVDQLMGLCARMDQEAFIPLTSEELTTSIYRRVHELGLIVDEITAELVNDGSFSTKGLRASASNGTYGRYARLRGVNVFLHVSALKWSQRGCPFWLTCYPQQWSAGDPQPLARCLEAQLVPGGRLQLQLDPQGFASVALPLHAGEERHEIISRVATEIRLIGEMVAAHGAAPADVLPAPDPVEGS